MLPKLLSVTRPTRVLVHRQTRLTFTRSDLFNLLNEGTNEMYDGNYETALTLFDQVLKNDQENIEALVSKAYCLEEKGDLEGASQSYRKVIDLDSSHFVALFNLGNIQLSTHQYESAIKNFSLCCELDPTHFATCNNLALAHKEAGNHNL
eukprot:TRINITY_DN8104_c0_g2_i2.p1 TRINITY_DN8104_c0_g2~~TRINITY_DN8104_c0_g2_i2.p1  ORF type:complete len:150 (-),score=29.18 TRINITY_DN8104_c0_g2_i2:88-537(-)